MTVRCFATHPYAWVSQDVGDLQHWSIPDDPDEPLGTKEKQWVTDSEGTRWLFKFARPHTDRTLGEDWCECVVHALAGLLGVPSACVAPATLDSQRGVLSRSFVESGWRLEHGNEILVRLNPSYVQGTKRENPGYTVRAVHQALLDVSPPPSLPHMSAFDAWAGYLILDAWTASRDRHHENWGVLQGPSGGPVLAPSFDHGSALGFQEPEQRLGTLEGSDELKKWCQRGCSHHFAGRPQLVHLAHDALAACTPGGRSYWLHRLEDVQLEDVREVINAVPEHFLSVARRSFILKLLDYNRGRLLDAISD